MPPRLQSRNLLPGHIHGQHGNGDHHGAGRNAWHQVDVTWDNGRNLMLTLPRSASRSSGIRPGFEIPIAGESIVVYTMCIPQKELRIWKRP